MSEGGAGERARRGYWCTRCDEPVRAYSWENRRGLNGFGVGCSCTSPPSIPYETTQAESPDNWRIRREPCCRDKDVLDLEDMGYTEGTASFRCPECGATYTFDGRMVDYPETPETEVPEDQETLEDTA